MEAHRQLGVLGPNLLEFRQLGARVGCETGWRWRQSRLRCAVDRNRTYPRCLELCHDACAACPDGAFESNPAVRSPRNQNLARILIPADLGQAHYRVVVCQRRDVDRSVLHVAATGAWKESLTEGLRSRRSGLTGSGKAPVMAGSRCPP